MTERFPDTWVGLTDIVYEPDGITAESAVVSISGDKLTVVGVKNDGVVATTLYSSHRTGTSIRTEETGCACKIRT